MFANLHARGSECSDTLCIIHFCKVNIILGHFNQGKNKAKKLRKVDNFLFMGVDKFYDPRWLKRKNPAHFLLSTNDKTIKLWKVGIFLMLQCTIEPVSIFVWLLVQYIQSHISPRTVLKYFQPL